MGADKRLGPLVGSIIVTVKKDMGFGRVNQPIKDAVVELFANNLTRLKLTDDIGVAQFDSIISGELFLVRVTAPEVSNDFLQLTDYTSASGNSLEFTF